MLGFVASKTDLSKSISEICKKENKIGNYILHLFFFAFFANNPIFFVIFENLFESINDKP